MATPTIVDPQGNPVSSTSLYKTPSNYRNGSRLYAQPRPKTYEAISSWQRREMVDVSRVIAAGVMNIDNALLQAGEFTVGEAWQLKSRCGNKAWGKRRDEWFNGTFARDCNIRGIQNDWRSSLRQLNWTRKVEADYGIVFDGKPYKDSTGKEHTPSGKFQIIKYDRISSGLSGAAAVGRGLEQIKEVGRNSYAGYLTNGGGGWIGMYIINDPGSPFDGQRILDGVIFNANMRVLGYRVTGFSDKGIPIYCDVPREQIHVNFSARKQADLIRGIPELAESIIPIMNLDDIQYLISMAIKLASAMAVARKSTDGNPNRAGRSAYDEDTTATDAEGNTVTSTQRRAVEEIFPGIIELATNNGEELEAMAFNRPSMNEEAFVERVETAVLYKLWPRDLIYGADTKRGGARAIAAQAQSICRWDQTCLERDARFIANQSTAYAMAAGYIPTYAVLDEPYRYVFTVPGEFTIDQGQDSKARLTALGRCTISRGIICEADGYQAEEIEEQREAEEHRLMLAAERLSEQHKWISEKEALLRLDSGDSHISFSDNAQIDETEADGLGAGGAKEEKTTPKGGNEKPPAKTERNGFDHAAAGRR